MARLDVALGELSELWAQRSGDSERLKKPPGVVDAADRGLGIGLNSEALALSMRGEEIGDAGRLAVY